MNREHGLCFVTIEDDIIFLKAIGAFNLEGMVKANNDVGLIIENLNNNKFKLFVDYSELEGVTPEAFEKLNDFNIWLNKQNMVAKAVVINSAITLSILDHRSPARSLHNDKNFEDREEALNWLKIQ